MTYSVYQHWDPLKVMAVGISYPPELYDYIKNEKVRKVFYQIAEETEEDYQKLLKFVTNLTPQEATEFLKKLKIEKDPNEIKVGDEVIIFLLHYVIRSFGIGNGDRM